MTDMSHDDLSSKVGIIDTQLKTLITTVERYIVSSDTRQSSLESKVNERGQFRLPVFVSVIGVLAIIIGGAFTILKQQTDLSVALALAPIAAQNQVSVTDRNEIRLTITRNGERISDLESSLVRQTERATEVETQIHDLHAIGNLDRAYQMAFIASLWRKSFDQDLSYRATETQPRVLPR